MPWGLRGGRDHCQLGGQERTFWKRTLAFDGRWATGRAWRLVGFFVGRDGGHDISDIRNKSRQGARKVLDILGDQWAIWVSWAQAMSQVAMVVLDPIWTVLLILSEHAFYLVGSREMFSEFVCDLVWTVVQDKSPTAECRMYCKWKELRGRTAKKRMRAESWWKLTRPELGWWQWEWKAEARFMQAVVEERTHRPLHV